MRIVAFSRGIEMVVLRQEIENGIDYARNMSHEGLAMRCREAAT